jgi:mannose-6-phosphate isomerase-like protein (cupin superfamily)
MTNPLTPDSQSTPDSESGDAQAARYHVISDSPGIDNAEQWSESFEGKEYEVGISTIHLSTTKVDVGPPLHTHPYPEVVKIRRGRSTFTVGTKQLSATAGQTVFVPADTPHTFRTLAPDRYESLAIHVSPAFISTLLEAGNDFS